jgi:hypothetical protein
MHIRYRNEKSKAFNDKEMAFTFQPARCAASPLPAISENGFKLTSL